MPTRSKPLSFLRGPANVDQALTGLNDGPVSDDAALEDGPLPDGHSDTEDRRINGAFRGHGSIIHQQGSMD